MIKRTLAILITALVVAAAPALAGVITIDFTNLGDITNTSLSQDGHGNFPFYTTFNNVVSFTYVVDLGAAPNEFATVQTPADGINGHLGGIFGINLGETDPEPLTGSLYVTFLQTGVRGLSFTYTTDGDGAGGVFGTIGNDSPYNTDVAGTFQYGTLASGPGAEFNAASFAFTGTNFTLTNMQYDWVPEPASFLLIGGGLLGLGCVKRFRRKA